MPTWPPALLATRDALDPLFRAARYRPVGLEHVGKGARSGTAEYRTESRRLRIVCEGEEGALWVDTAAERDAQIISPWIDIEWLVTGRRAPPRIGMGPDRIAELIELVGAYLSGERAAETT
jgi:hypothetical protein